MAKNNITELLGDQAEYLLNHTCKTIDKDTLHLPSADHVDKIWINSNRSNQVLRSLQALLGHGRLANTGYCSIFPVDQGIEHSAGSAFSPNPIYFDPENIIKLAIRSTTTSSSVFLTSTTKRCLDQSKMPGKWGL
jgi:class I fructose-bisphosphate aldolase